MEIAMQKQCAGCGAVFEDSEKPLGEVHPRPYGCCPECNKTSFRSQEHAEAKPVDAEKVS
jgi:predicted  nucleic acid-binding Zn-ribbon protein